MSKAIAISALMALMTLNQLGYYWFTYGLWPRSWGAFVVFFLTGTAIYSLLRAVQNSDD